MQFDTTLEAGGPQGEALTSDAFETTSPFFEATAAPASVSGSQGYAPWAEALSPFAGAETAFGGEEEDHELETIRHQLHDEGFHEALAELTEETEQAVSERFTGEASIYANERERFAQSYLSGVQFEAEQYLDNLTSGIGGIDVAGFAPEQFDEMLARFDPTPGELSPAGEEFVGKLVKKAKSVIKVVAKAAKAAGKLAAPFLAPLLKQLRALIAPLLKRVLSLAIGRLPEPLRPVAQKLADKLLNKVASSGELEGEEMAPATPIDAEALADSFDLRLAEAIVRPSVGDGEGEGFEAGRDATFAESHDLQRLAEARGAMIDRLNAVGGQQQDLAPVIEQFLPAILTAVRTGIRLIGRPKVVSFLAGYLAKMIQRWVDPAQAPQLANAIVDTGMKMISLEAEAEGIASEAGQVALASVIEDTVRRFAENEDYIFENEDLVQVAASDAFGEAVAAHFPQEHVRAELQLAPSLGGAFVTRQPRHLRAYAKYNRTPEVELSARAADAIPSFGGSSLGAKMRAAGTQFPVRARLHVYQAKPGSTVATMLRHDRIGQSAGAQAHPLTPAAAGILLREPGLGTGVARRFMRSHRRIAAGQRVFVLEPLVGALAAQGKPAPGRVWIAVNAAKGRITVGFYLSEPEAQRIAEAIRKGRGYGDLLRRLLSDIRSDARTSREAEGADEALYEDGESFEDFAAGAGRLLPQGAKTLLRRKIAAWALPAVSVWLRQNTEPFLRAAADPRPGVTIRVRLSGVPGLAQGSAGGIPSLATFANALRGKPAVTVLVRPGRDS